MLDASDAGAAFMRINGEVSMPRTADPARHLEQIISSLQARRQVLTSEIAEIDALFERFGIQPVERRRPGRPAGRKAAVAGPKPARRGRRRKRGKFEKSGQQSIIDFLKTKGAKGATTAEINDHWVSEGRAGTAYVTLGQLTKLKQIKKEKLKGKRGSRYTA